MNNQESSVSIVRLGVGEAYPADLETWLQGGVWIRKLQFKTSNQISGIAFSPHDVRRTFITEALATGAPLADVQAQVGHKNESTTLRYANSVDARQRRDRLRLRYGS